MAVELLALYGDDGQEIGTYLEDGTPVIFGTEDELGSFWSKLRRGIGKAARFTPAYWAAKGMKWAGKHNPQYLAAKKAAEMLRRKHRHKIHGDDFLYVQGDEAVYVYGEDDERIGAFLPGLKKIGRFTSRFTTGLARAIGVPQSVLNALSHVDPTSKGSAGSVIASLIPSGGGPSKDIIAVPASAHKMDWKKIAIIGGAGVGAVIVLKILIGSPRRTAAV